MNQSELEAVLVNGKFRNTNTLVSIPLLIGQENGGKDFNNAWAMQTEDVEELLSACYRQSSLLRSYCLNITSFLASLHGIFGCRLQTVYVWRKSSAWSSSELKMIDSFVLPKTALHVNKLGL